MNGVLSFCLLCVFLAAGKLLRVKLRFLQRLYLPSSVIGGILGLIVLQVGGDSVPAVWTAGWRALPGVLINIVFATLSAAVAAGFVDNFDAAGLGPLFAHLGDHRDAGTRFQAVEVIVQDAVAVEVILAAVDPPHKAVPF